MRSPIAKQDPDDRSNTPYMSTAFNQDRLERIAPFLKAKYLDTGRMPHAAVLVGTKDGPSFHSLQGDAREGQPLAEDTIYRIASMTKPLTSIAFMQLVEQGKVALSNYVHDVIPEWKNLGVFQAGGGEAPFQSRRPKRPMQMIDLLRHTSGLTYGFQERTPVDAAYRRDKLDSFNAQYDLETFLKKIAEYPLLFDPGESWNYSISTDVLGGVIQRIADQPFDAYLKEHVLDPLGMEDTHFEVPKDKADRLADAYYFHSAEKKKLFDPGGPMSKWANPRAMPSGGGGLASTIGDYERFCRMLLGQGEYEGARVIGRKSLDLMTANHLPGGKDLTELSVSLFSEADNAGVGFGLGFAGTMDPHKTLTPGSAGDFYWGGMFSTAFFIDPAEELFMIFMTQLMPSSTYPVRRELKTMIYAALE